MTFEQIQEIVSNIKYKNWYVEVFAMPKYTVRVSWFDADINTGKRELQISREWFLDPKTLTEDMIVSTVFKCIHNAEDHEVRENFKYKGKRIYDPHISLKTLMERCDD